jgi:hypothetical protein
MDDPVHGKLWITTQGYAALAQVSHPTAGSNGHTYLHRKVLYDAIGPGDHPCHWCETIVEWFAKGERKLVVDHLDNDKLNNERSNLVASCHRCNATRGLFRSWMLKHQNDPFLLTLLKANANRK